LIRIAINEALQRIRKERRWETTEGAEELEGEAMQTMSIRPPNPEEQAGTRELASSVESALDEVPEHYRVVFMLREVEGLSSAETAEALGLEVEAVKQRLHRARGFLREALDAKVGQSARHLFAFHASRCDRVVANVLERIAGVR
jgi:RNA polymerase sigma-70 factor (ECF subfamily)